MRVRAVESKHTGALVALAVAALAVALLVLAVSAEPSLADQDEQTFFTQVVNGQPADPGEYPAQGFLETKIDQNYHYRCGGTLVGERHFLTAAHCIDDNQGNPLPPGNLRTALGEVDRNQFTSDDWYGITAVDVHANYTDNTPRNDVAMLTLDRPASLRPMRVVNANETSLWSEGVTARIIGWGNKSTRGPTSNVLMEADIPIRSDADCAYAYGHWFDQQTMVCAGNGTASTCFGDSGGPLLVPDTATAATSDFALAGIVSWGTPECNVPSHPTVFTRIGAQSLNSWVHARIGAPAVSSVKPPKTLSANITVRFSEPMKADTLMQMRDPADDPTVPRTSQTIKLFKGAQEVFAKVSCTNASCQTVTLNPDKRLRGGTKYTVRIEGAAADADGEPENDGGLAVKNVSGRDLAQDFAKPFKTRS